MLYRRAVALVNEANQLEQAADKLPASWEALITLAVKILVPSTKLLTCLAQFGQESPGTRIELIESVLGGTADALLSGQVDHPLHHQAHPLIYRDLPNFRHVVVRDSSNKRDQQAVTVEVDQRWTVSHIATSSEAVSNGHGFD